MITAEVRALVNEYRYAALGLQAAAEAAAFRRSLVRVQEADLAVLVLNANLEDPLDRADLAAAVEILARHRDATQQTVTSAEHARNRYRRAQAALLTAHPHLSAFIAS